MLIHATGNHDWSRDDDAMLKRLVLAGDYSMSGIAELFARNGINVSRNAVIGRVTRLRERGELPPARPTLRPKAASRTPLAPAPRVDLRLSVPPAERRGAKPRTVEIVKPASVGKSEAITPIFIPPEPAGPAKPLGLFDPWPARACRYPLFGLSVRSDEPVFCGATAGKPPYCEAHRRLVYSRPDPDRDGRSQSRPSIGDRAFTPKERPR